MTLRALIADDEPLAREWVRRQLEADEDLEVVGEAEDGFAAARSIEELAPDVVFLDVQMPGLDGFGVLSAIRSAAAPAVVFVTAFDRYAVQAFDVSAVDYVMKPFSRARFKAALEKAKEAAGRGGSRRELEALRAHLASGGRHVEWLLVKMGERSVFLKLRDVDWVESSRNNVILHAGGRQHVFAASMKAMEESLDPAVFLRIHRSAIVNLEKVKEVQPWFKGEVRVMLADGTALTLSEGYRAALSRFRRLPG